MRLFRRERDDFTLLSGTSSDPKFKISNMSREHGYYPKLDDPPLTRWSRIKGRLAHLFE